VTGLRISEALALTREDVDLRNGLLTIRGAKFGKTRLLPLHPSACRALARYAQQRDKLLDPPRATNFLLCASGRPPEVSTVRRVFYQLSRQTGLRGPADRRGPRLQAFRHRCAMEILLKWYEAGEDVERRLPALSTFLGHGHISETFWYLSGSSELLEQAARRLESRWEVQP
jgi:integrase